MTTTRIATRRVRLRRAHLHAPMLAAASGAGKEDALISGRSPTADDAIRAGARRRRTVEL